MTTLFISDLHLEADRPEIGKQFLAFLEGEARSAEALCILGDWYEQGSVLRWDESGYSLDVMPRA